MFQTKDIYHRKLGTDSIAELNKGSLNYSEEQNKLGEGSYGNVYHGDYEGMSVLVKQFGLPSLRQMFLRDLKPSDMTFFTVSKCTLSYFSG